MSSMAISSKRSHLDLPAGLILPSRELKQYRRWQNLHTTLKPAQQGYLPTAIEYEEFQQWLKKQDSGYFSDVFEDIHDHINFSTSPSGTRVASLCGHPIHPVAATQSSLRCPVCTIDIYLKYMKVLTRTLQSANGRPLPRTGTPSSHQENLYLAWSQGKLSVLRQVCELEELSTQEVQWSMAHPQTHVGDIQSAEKALHLYWSETAACPSNESRSLKKKTIVFADDTKFDAGRPAEYFLRSSPRYEPGRYTILNEQCDEEDYLEDGLSEDSDDYLCNKVILLGGAEDTSCHEESEKLEQADDEVDEEEEGSDWEDIDSDDEDEEVCEGTHLDEDEDEDSFIVFSLE